MIWKPIFTSKKDIDQIIRILDVVSYEIKFSDNSQSYGLVSGAAGDSIFWHYLSKYYSSKEYSLSSFKCLCRSLEQVQNNTDHSFSTGISGVLWAFCHLNERGGVKAEIDKTIGRPVSNYIFEMSLRDLNIGHYDYLIGGTGSLLHLLQRCDNQNIRKMITTLIDKLINFDYGNNPEVPWKDQITDFKGAFNLGLAHGIPSIIVIMSRILEKKIIVPGLLNKIEKSIDWLIRQQNTKTSISLFPNAVPNTIFESRLGWCYGDLGIAIAILQAGIITMNPIWQERAIQIAIHSSKRKDLLENRVNDAILCHGSAGIAHIFNRLYQYTGISEFHQAAIYWYSKTVEHFLEKGKFDMWVHSSVKTETEPYVPLPGIIEGKTGVGLSLLSSISNIEPAWDRCILLS